MMMASSIHLLASTNPKTIFFTSVKTVTEKNREIDELDQRSNATNYCPLKREKYSKLKSLTKNSI